MTTTASVDKFLTIINNPPVSDTTLRAAKTLVDGYVDNSRRGDDKILRSHLRILTDPQISRYSPRERRYDTTTEYPVLSRSLRDIILYNVNLITNQQELWTSLPDTVYAATMTHIADLAADYPLGLNYTIIYAPSTGGAPSVAVQRNMAQHQQQPPHYIHYVYKPKDIREAITRLFNLATLPTSAGHRSKNYTVVVRTEITLYYIKCIL